MDVRCLRCEDRSFPTSIPTTSSTTTIPELQPWVRVEHDTECPPTGPNMATDGATLAHEDLEQVAEVSWQTAWWALVPLAIGTMTQPCGKVLGSSDRNVRFYIRASPLICALECIYFLVLILLGLSTSWRCFVKNFKNELNHRFADEHADHMQAESSRLVRITLLVLSGIPFQTIKLTAMTGIPWTQRTALAFFTSIVFWEVIAALAGSYRLNASSVTLGPLKWRRRYPENAWLSKARETTLLLHFSLAGKVIFRVLACQNLKLVELSRPNANFGVMFSTLAWVVVPPALLHMVLRFATPTHHRVWEIS